MAIIFSVPYLVWRLGRTDYFAPLVVVARRTGQVGGDAVRDDRRVELDPHKAWEHRRESTVAAGLALGIPLLSGTIVAVAMLRFPGWVGMRANPGSS